MLIPKTIQSNRFSTHFFEWPTVSFLSRTCSGLLDPEHFPVMANDGKAAAESLIPLFRFQQFLNQDQNGRRIALLGTIDDQRALMTIERAAFPTAPSVVKAFLVGISQVSNLGSNDIYRWYMASYSPSKETPVSEREENDAPFPDLKLNLIYPCTDSHIKKYSRQTLRMVTETPNIYANHVHQYMREKREEGRLNWVFNIIEGRTEQEDVILREHHSGTGPDVEGFLLLPDLNWDRQTIDSLHLLALVERRDIWSLRDLKKMHVDWLRLMKEKILQATVGIYGGRGIEPDMLKLYVHCKANDSVQ